jgi:hypothetical protein
VNRRRSRGGSLAVRPGRRSAADRQDAGPARWLTQRDIATRIEAAATALGRPQASAGDEPWAIAPAEFVRRLSPWMVLN